MFLEEPSSPITPSALSWGDIMDEVDPLPSSPLSTSSASWGDTMDEVDPLPSSPPSPSVRTWGHIFKMEEKKLKVLNVEEKEDDKVSREKKKHIQEVKEKKSEKVIMEGKKEIQEVKEKKKDEEVSRNKPCHSKSTKTLELCIRNLDYRVDEEWLREEFLPFGDVMSAKVKTENGRSRGIGFVKFASVREAMAAMAEMDGEMLGRRRIYISLSKNREEPRSYASRTVQRRSESSHNVVPPSQRPSGKTKSLNLYK